MRRVHAHGGRLLLRRGHSDVHRLVCGDLARTCPARPKSLLRKTCGSCQACHPALTAAPAPTRMPATSIASNVAYADVSEGVGCVTHQVPLGISVAVCRSGWFNAMVIRDRHLAYQWSRCRAVAAPGVGEAQRFTAPGPLTRGQTASTFALTVGVPDPWPRAGPTVGRPSPVGQHVQGGCHEQRSRRACAAGALSVLGRGSTGRRQCCSPSRHSDLAGLDRAPPRRRARSGRWLARVAARDRTRARRLGQLRPRGNEWRHTRPVRPQVGNS